MLCNIIFAIVVLTFLYLYSEGHLLLSIFLVDKAIPFSIRYEESLVIKLVPPSYFSWMNSDQRSALANETLLSDNLSCSGDSGGPLTALYKGESVYLGTTPLGFTPGYYCGAGTSRTNDKPSGYFSPVYKHLDLIKAAEDFIKANPATTSKSTVTCIKGKLEKKVTGSNPKCPKGYKKK